MKDEKHSRRQFISKYLVSGTMALGGAVVFGLSSMSSFAKDRETPGADAQTKPAAKSKPVQKKPATVAAKNPCDDMTGVAPSELEKRRKLAYVPKAPIPDSHCGNCALYLPPAAGKACGGCVLFKGPVRAEGSCAYWAPKES